ncbi:MAG: superinfection immunity protein [Candidatus Puniceispirillaceae bacterium]
MEEFGATLLLLILILIYLFPAIVALWRAHNNTLAIFMLNLFLGWAFFGWVFALVWACTNNAQVKVQNTDDPHPM